MKKEKFKLLLEDLYGLYNKEHLRYVDSLVDKYHDTPYTAIDMIFLKYNHHSFSHYDPNRSTEEYKLNLIKEYSNGNRPLLDINLVLDSKNHKEKEVEAIELPKKIESEVNGFKEYFDQRLSEISSKINDDDIEYTIIVNNNDREGEPILPNKRHIASLGVGARMVLSLQEDKGIAGYIIKDIIYDSISIPEKYSITIFIERS